MCLRSHYPHKKKYTWNFDLSFCMLHKDNKSYFMVKFQNFWGTFTIFFLFYKIRNFMAKPQFHGNFCSSLDILHSLLIYFKGFERKKSHAGREKSKFGTRLKFWSERIRPAVPWHSPAVLWSVSMLVPAREDPSLHAMIRPDARPGTHWSVPMLVPARDEPSRHAMILPDARPGTRWSFPMLIPTRYAMIRTDARPGTRWSYFFVVRTLGWSVPMLVTRNSEPRFQGDTTPLYIALAPFPDLAPVYINMFEESLPP